MFKLFAYGTLNDPSVQERLFGRVITGAADTLDGYHTDSVTTDGETYLAAVPRAGASIEGRVLDFTFGDLAAADAYEGEEYDRVTVRLRSGVEAWTYVKK
ncbi:MAG: hypothetical protein RLZZ324_93 [Candidatus Parcubacteria bacterium]|jgi:gamma-glutamylcyclotransferase (GGCT)/AIG2-like uncharacterized protein YtfP